MLKDLLDRIHDQFRRTLASRMKKLGGKFQMEHRDSQGNLKGVYDFPNGIVDEGLTDLLDVYFHVGSGTATWYIGIIDNSGFSALADADVMNSHAGWNEFTTYTEATRVAWAEDAPAARSITNTTSSDFAITGSGTLKGIFIVSNSTKSGTTGILWATAAFASTVAVVNGDSLKITYTVSG